MLLNAAACCRAHVKGMVAVVYMCVCAELEPAHKECKEQHQFPWKSKPVLAINQAGWREARGACHFYH